MAVSVAAALTVAVGSAAAIAPVRALARPSQTGAVALSGSSILFVVGESAAACDRVETWSLASRAVVRLGRPSPLPCKDAPSTGSGVWSVSTARSRAVWLTYVGGNTREWELWTATPTRPAPRRLRLVARPVEDPPPLVLGPGSSHGVPYASGRTLVFLGDDGAARFVRQLDADVALVAAGDGGGRGIEVAAVLETGAVVAFDLAGTEVARWALAPAAVEAVRVAGGLVAVQTPGERGRVSVLALGAGRRASWPVAPGARLVGLAPPGGRLGPRILVEHARGAKVGDLWLLGSPGGAGGGGRVADGTLDRPARGALDPAGVAWTIGRTVRWAPLPTG